MLERDEGKRGGGRNWMPVRHSRRALLRAATLATGAAALPHEAATAFPLASQTPEITDAMAIDLAAEPPTLDPALAYSVDGWSIIHSVYDAPIQVGPDGTVEMVAAEAMTQIDPMTWEIRLRQGITFHNGEPLESSSIVFSIAHLLDPATASQVAGTFAVIDKVEVIDALTTRLHLSSPAPWLPSQIAPWLALLPPKYAADPGDDFTVNPVGTGPYRFVRWDRGSHLSLERNDGYFGGGAKGSPIARHVDYRFVLDGTTRVTDVVSGTSQLVTGVPGDEIDMVSDAAQIIASPVVGAAFVRLPTDAPPFDKPEVRVALNHAVDVEAIIASLLGGRGQRLANIFPPGGVGYDADLTPYAYDPDLAKQLLAKAGYANGFSTRFAYATTNRADQAEAIAGQLAAVNISVELEPVEVATFNATWADPQAAPLRLVTWRPLFDPYTLLSLVIAKNGYLSRYDDAQAQPLIDAGAVETDPAKRERIYRDLGRVLHNSPAGIYLWNLTSIYGVAIDAPAWTPRPDDWVLPLVARGA